MPIIIVENGEEERIKPNFSFTVSKNRSGQDMKFEKHDKVIFQKSMSAEVVAVVRNTDKPYGITYTTPKGVKKTLFTTEKQLIKKRDRNNLQVGDKFISRKDQNEKEIIYVTADVVRDCYPPFSLTEHKVYITKTELESGQQVIQKKFVQDVGEVTYNEL